MKTWVVLGDIQLPFADAPVLARVLDFIDDIAPHGVVLNGDIVDCHALSVFDKNPLTKPGLQSEVDAAGKLLARLAKKPVVTERWWVGGNHEDRLRRYLWTHPDIADLRALEFERLFELDRYGFQWVPYGESVELGRLTVTHGLTVARHSAWTARAHLERYGASVLVGHSHRLGAFYKRDRRGVHAGWEGGCLCRLDPEYDPFPNWQQGFTVVQVEPDGTFNVQLVPIVDRKLFSYGGEQYVIRGGGRK